MLKEKHAYLYYITQFYPLLFAMTFLPLYSMLQEKHAYLYYMYITQFYPLLFAMTFLPLKMIPRVTYY